METLFRKYRNWEEIDTALRVQRDNSMEFLVANLVSTIVAKAGKTTQEIELDTN